MIIIGGSHFAFGQIIIGEQSSTQKSAIPSKDSVIGSIKSVVEDTLRTTVSNDINSLKSRIQNSLSGIQKIKIEDVKTRQIPSFSFNKIFTKPMLKFGGGYVAYNSNFRSGIDTPVAEKNILQQNLAGSLNMFVAGLPLRTNFLIRRSNSNYFTNITDIQVEFDASKFHEQLQTGLKERLLSLILNLRDSILELQYKFSLKEFVEKNNWLENPVHKQKLLESYEILNIPSDTTIADSTERVKISKLKREATDFISKYKEYKQEASVLNERKDSLEKSYRAMIGKVSAYENFIRNKAGASVGSDAIQDSLKRYNITGVQIPKMYSLLANVRKFGVGRNQVNYSELTGKNISQRGVNFEYSSWYYIAFAVGSVEYRFRDFVVNKFNKSPQYMMLGRFGIGKPERSHFFVSAYKGRKQLFASAGNSSGVQSINIHGISAEAKISFHGASYFTAEVAQSVSPDFRKSPVVTQKFDLKDGTNKAVFLKLYLQSSKTFSRIEANYKYTGANFQSFSSFQTNSMVKSWSVKVEQKLLRKRLSLTGSVRTNDFSNPYIPLNYKSNTIFKSIQAVFKGKRLPVISLGFSPMSQLTLVDSLLRENTFNSLNANVYHFYKIGDKKATTSLVYNRFYNNESDTSFSYYNAQNIFITQSVSFELYTLSVSVSSSKSPSFELNVLDANINLKLGKQSALSLGVKVNDFNKEVSKSGFYGNIQFNLGKLGLLNASYDYGYLPTIRRQFIQNNIMNASLIKQF